MTEIEWLTATDPLPMLRAVHGRVAEYKMSDRKLRLFACACCQRVKALLTSDDLAALAVVERFANGLATGAELQSVVPGVAPAVRNAARSNAADAAMHAALATVTLLGDASGDRTHPKGEGDCYAAEAGERVAQTRLLRDIYGNPFRPMAIDPSWLTSTVRLLAEGIYAERAFDRMPILADALQDAGCENDEVLNHCRGPGPHVRGCWVVDLVLGKE